VATDGRSSHDRIEPVAIDYGYNPKKPRRRIIAWAFAQPDPRGIAAFDDRGFGVPAAAWGDAELSDNGTLSGAAAVVFTQAPEKPEEIATHLAAYGQRLLDFDCNVIVLRVPGGARPIANVANRQRLPIARLPVDEVPELAREIAQWQRSDVEPPRPYFRLYVQPFDWKDIANYEIERPAGPAPGATNVQPSRARTISDTVRLLARRAFFDCSEVQLTPLLGGKSKARVFLAHAVFQGRWSLPYLVKTGPRDQITGEYINYTEHVHASLPFHLGPKVDPDRCGLSAHQGVLVGDFVDESEQLLDCARDGRAGPAISCLFERTLRGWARDSAPHDAVLGHLVRQFSPRRISPERLYLARALGATARTPSELRDTLRAGGQTPVLFGTTHGDLHASNVRVRGNDAILIDFLQCGNGPLVRDPAALEASLLVAALRPIKARKRAVRRAEETAQLGACRASLDPLYAADAIAFLPPHGNPKDEWSWFHACVRQIRMHAFHMERAPGQYALALAAELLFKATKDGSAPEPERSSRALAYVYGERLLLAVAPRFAQPAAPSQAVR
jgi:hypothetical protein